MSRIEQLNTILRQLLSGTPDIEACAPISEDGLIIVSAMPQHMEEGRVGEVTLLDVRPQDEFAAGHVGGALSIPLAELPTRMGELSKQHEVVAYCRGAFCVMASEAVALLRARGIKARAVDLNVVEMTDRGMRIRRPVPVAATTTAPAARRAKRPAGQSPTPPAKAPAAKRRQP